MLSSTSYFSYKSPENPTTLFPITYGIANVLPLSSSSSSNLLEFDFYNACCLSLTLSGQTQMILSKAQMFLFHTKKTIEINGPITTISERESKHSGQK